MRPIALRSSHVRYANVTMTRLMMITASMIAIHQGSCFTRSPSARCDVDGAEHVARELARDARDAGLHVLADARAERHRGAAAARR